jgi:hypothetical protein
MQHGVTAHTEKLMIFFLNEVVQDRVVPDRPLVRDPIRTLLEYSYELGV